MQLLLFNNQQNQGAGNMANGAAFASANLPASDLLNALVNDSLTFIYNNTTRASLASTFQFYCCDANFSDDYVPSGWQRSIRPGVRVELSSGEVAFYNSDIAGRHFHIYIGSLVCSPNLDTSVPANLHLISCSFTSKSFNFSHSASVSSSRFGCCNNPFYPCFTPAIILLLL